MQVCILDQGSSNSLHIIRWPRPLVSTPSLLPAERACGVIIQHGNIRMAPCSLLRAVRPSLHGLSTYIGSCEDGGNSLGAFRVACDSASAAAVSAKALTSATVIIGSSSADVGATPSVTRASLEARTAFSGSAVTSVADLPSDIRASCRDPVSLCHSLSEGSSPSSHATAVAPRMCGQVMAWPLRTHSTTLPAGWPRRLTAPTETTEQPAELRGELPRGEFRGELRGELRREVLGLLGTPQVAPGFIRTLLPSAAGLAK